MNIVLSVHHFWLYSDFRIKFLFQRWDGVPEVKVTYELIHDNMIPYTDLMYIPRPKLSVLIRQHFTQGCTCCFLNRAPIQSRQGQHIVHYVRRTWVQANKKKNQSAHDFIIFANPPHAFGWNYLYNTVCYYGVLLIVATIPSAKNEAAAQCLNSYRYRPSAPVTVHIKHQNGK